MLILGIANTRSVTPQVKEEVINEFYEVCLAQQYIAEGGINYAKELLEKALGSDKAMDVIGKLTASLQVKPFEFVRKTDATPADQLLLHGVRHSARPTRRSYFVPYLLRPPRTYDGRTYYVSTTTYVSDVPPVPVPDRTYGPEKVTGTDGT